MRTTFLSIAILFIIGLQILSCKKDNEKKVAIIIDHSCTDLSTIPVEWINKAKTDLHIAYGHTTYGSQLITGLNGLENWKDEPYLWNNGELEGSLDIRDAIMGGDLGQLGDITWAETTRTYLGDWRNEKINVIIWSWENGVSNNTQTGVDTYLTEMNKLENEYPNVKFVYMTGHLDGTGETGNLHLRNEQIREYCKTNNKILYDFADIESYDPSGNYFLNKDADGACDYDSNGDQINDANWATNWQNAHTEGIDWFDCSPAGTQPLNANLKAYATWWLWARLSGWSGE